MFLSRGVEVVRRRRAGVLVLAAAIYGVSLEGALGTAQATRTVWEGAYTEEQASRAVAAFGANCAECHTLSERGDSPLVGPTFWEGYSQKTVGDLLSYVRANMPNGNGNSLPASTYADLVALILKANGLPPGPADVAADAAAAIRIVPRDGSAVLPANTLARVVGCLTKSGSAWVLTQATAPERIERAGVGADDAQRPLGMGSMTLKFVLSRLDGFVGQRMSASGILMGAGGADGLNVSNVTRVAPNCP
jgi:mono/diheme cytochrome c family protein